MTLSKLLFGRTGGYYLFYASAIYLAVGTYIVFVDHFAPIELIQAVWIATLALPFICPPVGRYFNLDVTWDQKMLNMFKKKADNVVPFPKQETEYGGGDGGGYIEPPKKPPVTYYTLGMTSENRLEFKMGYSAITMNYGGVTNLIEQLEIYQKQLAEYEGIESEE